uniref:Uncharacterized protein n=1 Tax=Parascaris equorum TaxID=6256 RepID=A0A914RN86_PAREQ
MERMDSQCSRKHKRQNQPPSALFMDKDSLSNRLSQVKSMGSADDGDPLVKKESKIENLDLSQITDDDSKVLFYKKRYENHTTSRFWHS